MEDVTHEDAVNVLKKSSDKVLLVVMKTLYTAPASTPSRVPATREPPGHSPRTPVSPDSIGLSVPSRKPAMPSHDRGAPGVSPAVAESQVSK